MSASMLRAAVRFLRSADVREDVRHEWRRRFTGEPALPAGSLRNLLFVCHGNICRSPFAAAVLRDRAPGLGVRSCGLAAGVPAPADPDALRAAARFGVSLDGHASRRLAGEELVWADLVLVMQGHQLARIRSDWPGSESKLRVLGDFLPAPPYALPDPWGEPDETFDAVFRRTLEAVRRLAERLEVRRSA